jgi:hypothetical protein
MGETVQANDGNALPLDSLAQQFTYDGSFIETISVFYTNKLYVQTFTNDGTNIIAISGWIYTPPPPPSGQIMITQHGDIMTNEAGNIMITE